MDVELASVAGVVLLADAGVLDAVVVSEAVDVASVVVAVKAAARPVLKIPKIKRATRTLEVECQWRSNFRPLWRRDFRPPLLALKA
jgi:hypothetical protein